MPKFILGTHPSENIYIANRKKKKDISILLLLDVSLSSDSYVNGNRVIDIEKQVAILFGEIIQNLVLIFLYNVFIPKPEIILLFLTVKKDFEEDWNKVKFRMGAVAPSDLHASVQRFAALRHRCSAAVHQK